MRITESESQLKRQIDVGQKYYEYYDFVSKPYSKEMKKNDKAMRCVVLGGVGVNDEHLYVLIWYNKEKHESTTADVIAKCDDITDHPHKRNADTLEDIRRTAIKAIPYWDLRRHVFPLERVTEVYLGNFYFLKFFLKLDVNAEFYG